MWKSPDGIAHTVALPDPTSGMTEDFIRSIESLGQNDRELLVDAADDLYDVLDELLETMESREPPAPEDEAMPDGFLRGEFTSGSSIREYLDSVEPAWRLDAYEAVTDLLDRLDD